MGVISNKNAEYKAIGFRRWFAWVLLGIISAGMVLYVVFRMFVFTLKSDLTPYEWKATDKSFIPVESGNYIVFGVFKDSVYESEDACAAGYKAISVTDKEDINPGESEWLKNNLVSVILFSIAGVMLILIIILLFVKPSDETLEDIGNEKAAKKEKKSKK